MESLPDEILVLIFDQLDNRSMLSTMNTCQRFAKVYSSSSHLLKKFTFEVTSINLDHQITRMPNVSLRNLTFRDLGINTKGSYFLKENIKFLAGCHQPVSVEIEKLMVLVENYENSIEHLDMRNFHVDSGRRFLKIISKMKNLKSIKIDHCVMFEADNENPPPPSLPQLKSAFFTESSDLYFNVLQNFKSLENFKFVKERSSGVQFSYGLIDDLLIAVPSINHLTIKGVNTGGYLAREFENIPFTLHSLDADEMNMGRNEDEPRISFLRAQKGHLKVLKVKELPADYDGEILLKFIFEEMNLESFVYREKELIKNGRKIPSLNEIWMTDKTITAGMELMRQFPATKKLNLIFRWLADENENSERLINTETDIFRSITDLTIQNNGHSNYGLSFFIGLIKNCSNLAKLEIQCGPNGIYGGFFETCLPRLRHLKELRLSSKNLREFEEIFRAILHSHWGLKRIAVRENLIEGARGVFGENFELEIYEN